MMLTALLLHFLYKLPVWVKCSLSEVVLVLWLWCWSGWILISCFYTQWLRLFRSLLWVRHTLAFVSSSGKALGVSSYSRYYLWCGNVSFFSCVPVIKGWVLRECCLCHALDSEGSAPNFQTYLRNCTTFPLLITMTSTATCRTLSER